MKNLSSTDIRQMYLDFFKTKGHDILKSASLIPKDDPTLLWINSGVATMKKYFDGTVTPQNHRLTSSQKSIRTNDIENVGHTARHLTFFEMLGNFSIGDYFRKEAISWAWELLTSPKWFNLNKDRLFITVYPKDIDSKNMWIKMGVSENHIYTANDNFWDIGEGPCGPDSEIFYDRGEIFNNTNDLSQNYPGGENERYLEIWNIVFSEFNHKSDGTYEPLPHKNIDTGMGLERIVSVFQNTKTNFETDLFMPIIHELEGISLKYKYGQNDAIDIPFKVIADHIRTAVFAISDGALPSNENRGYVIRRLIRRAELYGRKLNINNAFLYRLVPIVGNIMKSAYPEILQQLDFIQKVIKKEENQFSKTLKDGIQLLDEVISNTKGNNKTTISGAMAFKLYDTYGFPMELTEEYAHDANIEVDEVGFKKEMNIQKERARNSRKKISSMSIKKNIFTDIDIKSIYVGYDQLKTYSQLEVISTNRENIINEVDKDTEAYMIFSVTPFYAEMGGQISDRGIIEDDSGHIVAKVIDVQHGPNGQNIHSVKVLGKMFVGQNYYLKVNKDIHNSIRKNHSATHLLDQTLRDVLGNHVHQAGSLVEDKYLRFDFTSLDPITKPQLLKIEDIINKKIWEELPVTTVETDIDSAKKMGAISLFDDKYGKQVRVVSIGDYSIEFCGGNHVNNTSEIGLFKIVSESSVGAGVRRIIAVTSKEAFRFLNNRNVYLEKIGSELNISKMEDVPQTVDKLLSNISVLESQKKSLEKKYIDQQSDIIFKNKQIVSNKTLIINNLKNYKMEQLRILSDKWKSCNLSNILILSTVSNGKVNVLVAIDNESIKKGMSAKKLIDIITPFIDGGGGGRDSFAQAGGNNPQGIQKAINAVINYIK